MAAKTLTNSILQKKTKDELTEMCRTRSIPPLTTKKAMIEAILKYEGILIINNTQDVDFIDYNNLGRYKLSQLKEIAKDLGLKGVSNLNKDTLISMILEYNTEATLPKIVSPIPRRSASTYNQKIPENLLKNSSTEPVIAIASDIEEDDPPPDIKQPLMPIVPNAKIIKDRMRTYKKQNKEDASPQIEVSIPIPKRPVKASYIPPIEVKVGTNPEYRQVYDSEDTMYEILKNVKDDPKSFWVSLATALSMTVEQLVRFIIKNRIAEDIRSQTSDKKIFRQVEDYVRKNIPYNADRDIIRLAALAVGRQIQIFLPDGNVEYYGEVSDSVIKMYKESPNSYALIRSHGAIMVNPLPPRIGIGDIPLDDLVYTPQDIQSIDKVAELLAQLHPTTQRRLSSLAEDDLAIYKSLGIV